MPSLPGVLPPRRRLAGARLAAVAIGIAVAALSTGCVPSMQLAAQQPSALTQLLLTRSLERALHELDVSHLAGRKVSVDLYAQSAGVQPFVKEYVTAWLQARNVHVAVGTQELAVKVFASAVGSDHGETFIGIPSIASPVIGVPIPEIAIFKWTRNRGLSELLVYVFDTASDALVQTIGPGIGHSKRDDFTVLIFLGFTVSDVDDREPGSGQAPPGSPARP